MIGFILIVFNHEVVFPGQQAGTVDGWLGFFGGLLGGFLAFVSAYYIYYRQRHDSVRPILVIEPANVVCGEMLHIIHRDTEIDEIPLKGTMQIPIRIINIGLAAALDLECSPTSKYFLYRSVPNGFGDENHDKFYLAGIQEAQSQTFDVLLQIPSLVENAEAIVELTLSYRGVYGVRYEVTGQIIIESTNRASSEHVIRTLKRT